MTRGSGVARQSGRALLVLILVGALVGCSPASKAPWFTAPIEWGQGYTQSAQKPFPIETVSTAVRVSDGKVAQLTDFPEGTTGTDKKGDVCLKVSSDERYTGSATWSNRDGYSIVLAFGTSSVTVTADNAGLGDQDWSGMIFNECSSGVHWYLPVQCGNPGYGGPGDKNKMVEPDCKE